MTAQQEIEVIENCLKDLGILLERTAVVTDYTSRRYIKGLLRSRLKELKSENQ